jgi:flagellar motor protein MotB
MITGEPDNLEGGEGPWPAFADLLAATTLLFLVLFAAIAVPAIGKARAAQNELDAKESTLLEIEDALRQDPHESVAVRRVGDYLLVTITGEAVFPVNEFELRQLQQQGRRILRSFGSSIRENHDLVGKIDQVQVVGHTSREGPNELNWRLSSSRAATVALFLIDSVGFNPCQISALGRSRHYPIDPEGARGGAIDERDRRIELEIRPVLPQDEDQLRRRENCVDYRQPR